MQANEGWSPATINRRLQAVRKFYSFAMETGLMEGMKAIQEREQTLTDRLSFTSSKKAKVAAIAAAAVLSGMVSQR